MSVEILARFALPLSPRYFPLVQGYSLLPSSTLGNHQIDISIIAVRPPSRTAAGCSTTPCQGPWATRRLRSSRVLVSTSESESSGHSARPWSQSYFQLRIRFDATAGFFAGLLARDEALHGPRPDCDRSYASRVMIYSIKMVVYMLLDCVPSRLRLFGKVLAALMSNTARQLAPPSYALTQTVGGVRTYPRPRRC